MTDLGLSRGLYNPQKFLDRSGTDPEIVVRRVAAKAFILNQSVLYPVKGGFAEGVIVSIETDTGSVHVQPSRGAKPVSFPATLIQPKSI